MRPEKRPENKQEILDYLKDKTLELLDKQKMALDNDDVEKFRVLQYKVETLIEIQKEILKGE